MYATCWTRPATCAHPVKEASKEEQHVVSALWRECSCIEPSKQAMTTSLWQDQNEAIILCTTCSRNIIVLTELLPSHVYAWTVTLPLSEFLILALPGVSHTCLGTADFYSNGHPISRCSGNDNSDDGGTADIQQNPPTL